jgi:hypothetical protein
MKIRASLKKKIIVVAFALLMAFTSGVFYVSPAAAQSGSDVSIAAMYKAMENAIDELWEGEAPRRSDIKIISKLPTSGAQHTARCIVGIPEGETPPEWKSDNPGEFEIIPVEGTDESNLKLENFEITIIRLSTGEEYTWKAAAEVFTEEYFTCINKETSGAELEWWEESQCSNITSKPLTSLEQSIGLTLSNELHDNYAHHLDEEVVGKTSESGTLLYLVAALAETGDKGEAATIRGLVDEASELIDGAHELVHHSLVPAAEEMGAGTTEAENLHNIAHELMGSIYKVDTYLGEIEKAEDIAAIQEKAAGMLAEAQALKELTSEFHTHSTDPATVLTDQMPLKLRDGTEEIEIKYEELGSYYSEMVKEEEEDGPVGGAIAFGVLVAGLVTVGIVRRSKTG